jgi:hypothetical protein
MRGLFISRRRPSRGIILANLGIGLAALLLSAPKLSADESPSTRLIRCGRDEAETMLTISFQLPGSAPMQEELYAKTFESGDEKRPPTGPSKAVDTMGTETTTLMEFGKTEVTFTIKQVPGPDRLHPYQVIIRVPFYRNIAGRIEGTKYEVTWNNSRSGKGEAGNAAAASSPLTPPPSVESEPIVSTVIISPKELMMLPHDARLVFDIPPSSEGGTGDWIRFQARGPTGEVTQIFRIQVLSDPGGSLGTDAFAESEVKAVCAPYLPNTLEKRCDVQRLKRASGDVYYCLLTNAALEGNPTPPAGQFRYFFVGVFRVGASVGFVIGNFSQKDDVSFRMMMETLGKISTLPVVTGTDMPAISGGSEGSI